MADDKEQIEMSITADQNNQGEQVERFVKLLTANQHRIYTYILSMMPNSSDADDIMQETTTIMWRKFSDYQAGTDFVAWGNAIAYYTTMNYRRKKKNVLHLSDEAIEALSFHTPKTTERMEHQMDRLSDCVKNLEIQDQRIVYMRYNQEMDVKTIAERLDMQLRRVYRHITRIHSLLLRCISRSEGIL